MRRRTADELRSLRGAPAIEVISTLNPSVRGQVNYYRTGASKAAYQAMDSTGALSGSSATVTPAPISTSTPG